MQHSFSGRVMVESFVYVLLYYELELLRRVVIISEVWTRIPPLALSASFDRWSPRSFIILSSRKIILFLFLQKASEEVGKSISYLSMAIIYPYFVQNNSSFLPKVYRYYYFEGIMLKESSYELSTELPNKEANMIAIE